MRSDRPVADRPAFLGPGATYFAEAPSHGVAFDIRFGEGIHVSRSAEELYHTAEHLPFGTLGPRLLAQVRGTVEVQVREQAEREALVLQRLFVREQGV